MSVCTNQVLFEKLEELDVIPEKKLKQSFEQAESSQQFLGDVLYEQDHITDENLGRVISDIISYPLVRLDQVDISKDALNIIPEIYARQNSVIAFRRDDKGVHLALANPNSRQVIEFLSKKTGQPIVAYLATTRDLALALDNYSQDIKSRFDDIISENISQAKSSNQNEPPIVKIVDTIVDYSYQNRASDVHLEIQNGESLVRFRVDGVLHDVVKLPLELHERIVTRIKVLSRLRTDEHLAPQDGKFQHTTPQENLDLRISIVPTATGEKIVMRLLSEKSRQFSINTLGMSESDQIKLTESYQKPFGMLLSAGPTGSGKTTSLYSILKILNQRSVNVMTVEDPIEFDIEGVNQMQVNVATGFTFAKGLRSIVRQDPDIILVGEIRDEETADIATNSAMTGHLVLSTIHANDAATAIPRLTDMKVEPFLIASSINCIIGQRLVREICNKCRTSKEITSDELVKLGFPKDLVKKYFSSKDHPRVYHGKGCPVCHDTGYSGRIGIFEVMVLDEDLKQAIINQDDATTIKQIAVKNGMTTMQEDGLRKVVSGITTVEEVIRVTQS
jgi:type IV pilus assembly protein PilB